jgi:hypothetical protein
MTIVPVKDGVGGGMGVKLEIVLSYYKKIENCVTINANKKCLLH